MLNKTLLLKESHIQELKMHLKNYFKDNSKDETSPEVRWDVMKAVITGHFIAIGSRGGN